MMDFESPDVMKEFPGLYSTESNRKSNDSDYSDELTEKVTKKDLLIGKRKDKKDTKKDRGYAALEGESSAEDDCESKSPSKSKKTKSFKFSTKNKEKRDKVRDKEKETEKKKDKDNRKNNERFKEKVKYDKKEKKTKLVNNEKIDISDVLPIFGVNLQLAVERSRCHDGVDLPLPVRNCIDYIQEYGMTVENVYKIAGIKSKVLHIKKLYSQREYVNMCDYDVPTATSVFKLFFRELPEPILVEYLSRFEEAAAIQNVSSRELSLLALVDKLPEYNRILLGWTILHLDSVTCNEIYTKMNAQSIAMALSPILQMSHRLLAALLCHCKSLFKDIVLFKYCPPLISSSVQLPEEAADIMCELRKQESLLSQIHEEMNSGFISKKREELLWEVQRMITQFKRKLRSIQKCHEVPQQKATEESGIPKVAKSLSYSDDDQSKSQHINDIRRSIEDSTEQLNCLKVSDEYLSAVTNDKDHLNEKRKEDSNTPDTAITIIQQQNISLIELKDSLLAQIAAEKSEIVLLKYCIANNQQQNSLQQLPTTNLDIDKLDELMDLIHKENKILQIKKTDLVREIMEQREACIYLRSKLAVHSTNVT